MRYVKRLNFKCACKKKKKGQTNLGSISARGAVTVVGEKLESELYKEDREITENDSERSTG